MGDGSPDRLLFLIADTGGGHRASAAAVARELSVRYPGRFAVHIVDPFTADAPRLMGGAANLYGPLIQHGRWLWGGLYHATDSRLAVAALRRTFLRAVDAGLARIIGTVDPVAIVSFHPLLNHAAAAVTRRVGAPPVPVITVITDLVDVHSAWACREVDAVVVPSPGGLDRCRRAGIPAHRCFALGLPVDRSFTEPRPQGAELTALRRRLGLPGERFMLLLCGGADGSGGIERRARALASAGLDIDLVVICGRNRRALQVLGRLRDARGDPIPVHGFVDNMADWMRAADAVVTKAGPGTIAEALCCGLPLLLSWYLPGQERGNVEWIADIGAGRYVPGLAQLVDTVRELAEPGSTALAGMRAAVTGAARPDATTRIADLVAGYAGAT